MRKGLLGASGETGFLEFRRPSPHLPPSVWTWRWEGAGLCHRHFYHKGGQPKTYALYRGTHTQRVDRVTEKLGQTTPSLRVSCGNQYISVCVNLI